MCPSRRPLAWRRRSRARHPQLGLVVQRDSPSRRDRLRATSRVRAELLPSVQPPAATAAGRTQPPLNPGRFNFTPTSSSWLNLVERWFKELTDRRLRRGVFTSVDDLLDAICGWAEHWNQDPKPFVWHKTAQEIIARTRRGRAALDRIKSATDH